MKLTVLKSKLHQARVTQVELEYDGSCAIDGQLLKLADIWEYEQIQIYNINNGERFTTYAIRAQDYSGTISINGAAARRAAVGDSIIICAYASMDAQEAKNHKPKLVYLGGDNSVERTAHSIAVQQRAG